MPSFLLATLLAVAVSAAPVPLAEPEPAAQGLPGGGLPLPTGGLPSFPAGGSFPTPTLGNGGALPSFPVGGGGGLPSLPFPIPTGGAGGIPSLPFPIPTGGSGGIPSLPFPIPTGGAGGIPSLPFPIPTGGAGGLPGLPGGESAGLPSLPIGERDASIEQAAPIEARQFGFGGSSTANDLVNGACKQVTFIFARGTSETGNMGSTVGPAFATQLKQRFGDANVAVQGVDYPADVSGAVSGSINPAQAAGAQKMAQLAKQAASKCPTSKIVLSGYSQGAQQVHGALMGLAGANNVGAAVTFGDPLSKTAFQNIDQSKTKVFCNEGDAVCNNSFVITPAHLSYGSTSAGPAADFVKSVLA